MPRPEGARYLVIGGFALILHGLVRTTKDIALLVDPSPENVKKVKQALASLPDNAAALVADDDVANYRVVRVADEFVVDLMAEACGLSFKDVAVEGIELHTVDGVAIPIASKETLIRTKATSRDSDRSDVGFLQHSGVCASEAHEPPRPDSLAAAHPPPG